MEVCWSFFVSGYWTRGVVLEIQNNGWNRKICFVSLKCIETTAEENNWTVPSLQVTCYIFCLWEKHNNVVHLTSRCLQSLNKTLNRNCMLAVLKKNLVSHNASLNIEKPIHLLLITSWREYDTVIINVGFFFYVSRYGFVTFENQEDADRIIKKEVWQMSDANFSVGFSVATNLAEVL